MIFMKLCPSFLRRPVFCAVALSHLVALGACSSGEDSTSIATLESSLSGAQQAELDDYIGAALERYQIPGAAVAVVRGGDVVYEGGFGIRGLVDPAPVTPRTRFPLASVNKPMTSLMLATLVDEGKLSWDVPVVEVLPTRAGIFSDRHAPHHPRFRPGHRRSGSCLAALLQRHDRRHRGGAARLRALRRLDAPGICRLV